MADLTDLTDIEQLVKESVEKIRADSNSSSIPTADLYHELYDRGAGLGYRPYGSKLNKVDPTTSEWLYDFSWWKIRENTRPQQIEALSLVLESEAGNQTAVLSDFRKLVQARAEHRVMVFRVPIEPVIQAAYEFVHTFKGSESADRYLFVQWGPSIRTALMVFPEKPKQL